MFRKPLILLALVVLAGLPAAADEMTLEQVLGKMVEARGGREALDAVQNVTMTAKMTGPTTGGMELPLTIEAKRPNKVRVEFTFQGMTGIQAYDGTTGWQVMPFLGKTDPEQMSAEQLEQMEEQADFDGPLIDYAEKGHQAELVGKEEVEGTPTYKIKLTKKNGDVEYHFLDAEYFLPIRAEGTTEFQGVETEFEASVGDYKEVGGVLWPHSFEQKAKGAPAGQVITIEEIAVNSGMSDDRFAMPEPAPAAEPAEGSEPAQPAEPDKADGK